MINKIIKTVKTFGMLVRLNVNIIKDAKNLKLTFNTDDINEDGYIFDYSPATLAGNKISIAGIQLISFGMFNTNLVPRIIYDDLFEQLSENAKRFVIEHEMGHFTLQQNILLNNSVRDIANEIEADLYAAEKIGRENAISALKEMRDLILDLNFGKSNESSEELLVRIYSI